MRNPLTRPHPPLPALALLGAVLLAGCATIEGLVGGEPPAEVEPQAAPSPTPADLVQDTPTPTVGDAPPPAEESGEVLLTVWLVNGVVPAEESGMLADTLAAFDQTYPDIRVQVLTKRIQGPGGMLDYTRTAPPVAPGVLPDLMLLDRPALLQASSEGTILPIETVLPEDSDFELYPVAQQLGSVDGVLVGLPYVLDTQHTVYRTTVFPDGPPNTYEILLEQEENPVAFTFPAGPVTGVSQTVLAQYLAEDGPLTNEEGTPRLDADSLTTVLAFYQEAREVEAFNPSDFQLSTVAETWERYLLGQSSFAVTSANLYLADREELRTTGLTWVPTEDGDPIALVDGLFWTMIAADPEQQEAALAFLEFMMDPITHGEFTQSVGWLPSQPTALEVWGSDDTYAAFADELLLNGRPLPDAETRNAVGAAIQEALEDVLINGELPEQAANEAALSINVDTGE